MKYNITKKKWLTSFIYVSVLLIIIWLIFPIRFETNDDSGLMSYLAGFKTGTPTTLVFYCQYLYSLLISSLYKITGAIPWYTIVFMLLLWLSAIVICRSFIHPFTDNKGVLLGLLTFTGIFIGLFMYSYIAITFTVVATICGTAAIAIILMFAGPDSPKQSIVNYALFFIFLLFCCSIRLKSSYPCLLVIACTLLLKKVLHDFSYKALSVFAILTVSAFLIVKLSSSIFVQNHEEWSAFKAYNIERSNFSDYGELPYSGNEELFSSVGWDENLYNLVSSWFFMDETINTETFSIVNEAYQQQNVNTPLSQKIINSIKLLKKMSWIYPILLSWLGIIIICLITSSQKSLLQKLGIVAYLIGGILLIVYLAYMGRFPRRTASTALFCSCVPGLILCMQLMASAIPSAIQAVRTKRWITYKSVRIGLLYTLSLLGFICIGIMQVLSLKDISTSIQTKKSMETYAIEHASNFYIFDNSLATAGNPFQVYKDKKPTNITFWGGSAAYSPMSQQQLEINGFEKIYALDFFNPQVFFIGKKNPSANLIVYMETRFPNCTCEIIDTTEYFIIYRFNMD